MRGGAALAIVAALLAGCASPPSSATPAVTTSPSPPATSHAGTPSAIPAASATPVLAVEPGRPYDAAAVLAAMRDSRRPGGVPDVIESDAIAAAVAAEVWTFDGEPWPALVIGGTCGAVSCALDLAGAPHGAAGEDAYQLTVDLATASVTVVGNDLHGYPEPLTAELDAMAREGLPADALDGLALRNARWLPPPDDGRFVLAYRSGGEEGSDARDVTIDATTGTVIDDDVS